MKSGANGTLGEHAVVDVVPCPNCGSKLVLLPPGFPLFDVQCTRCMFRAQVKTARCAPPRDQIFGAGWDVLDKTRKTGQLIPPLIVNYQWQDKATGENRQVVYFYPFLTKDNIRKRERSDKGQRPGYKEFNYVGLRDDNMPRMTLFPKGPKSRPKQEAQRKIR